MNENEFAPLGIDLYPVAFFEFPSKNLNRQRILNQSLDGAFERAGAVNRVEAAVGDQRLGALGDFQRHFSAGEVPAQPLELDFDDRFDFFATEIVEDDRFVDPVQKFRLESIAQGGVDPPLHLFAVLRTELQNILAAEVRRHDDDRVFEIDGSPLTVGHAAVFENLQQAR